MARVQGRMRSGGALVGLTLLCSCAAGRGTYFMAKSVEPISTVAESNAPDLAIFAWTMADEYRRKAWDEWSSSDYEEAERLSKLAVEWAEKARTISAAGGAVQILDEQVTMEQVRKALAALQGAPPAVEPAPAEDEEGLQ